jgi:hypothetical protein
MVASISLFTLCVDIFHSLSLYLSIEELGSLVAVNKFFSASCFSDDNYWLLRFSALIVPVQFSHHALHDQAKEEEEEGEARKLSRILLTCLQVPDFLTLYQCLHRFDLPLLGLWGREPRDLSADFRGGLLRIRVVPAGDGTGSGGGGSVVVTESLSPTGAVVAPCFSVAYLRGRSRRRARRGVLVAVNSFGIW